MRDGHQGALEGEVGVMTDREGESMSITRELREYVACWYHTRALFDVADRIDERFSRELTAKQDEVYALQGEILRLKMNLADACAERNGLQVKQGASIPMPLDADGEPWTGEDVDKPFLFADDAECKTLREIAITWWGRSWCLVDDYDTHYPADRCHHVASEPPESIEDVYDEAPQDQVSFDVIHRAYECGKRDAKYASGGYVDSFVLGGDAS